MHIIERFVWPAGDHHNVCKRCWGATDLLIQVKALPLPLHIGFIKVVTTHLILVLHEQLSIGHARRILDVLEVLNPLQLYTHG